MTAFACPLISLAVGLVFLEGAALADRPDLTATCWEIERISKEPGKPGPVYLQIIQDSPGIKGLVRASLLNPSQMALSLIKPLRQSDQLIPGAYVGYEGRDHEEKDALGNDDPLNGMLVLDIHAYGAERRPRMWLDRLMLKVHDGPKLTGRWLWQFALLAGEDGAIHATLLDCGEAYQHKTSGSLEPGGSGTSDGKKSVGTSSSTGAGGKSGQKSKPGSDFDPWADLPYTAVLGAISLASGALAVGAGKRALQNSGSRRVRPS